MLAEAFGSGGGKIGRATFVVGADGRVAHSWPKVSVGGHVEEVLAAVRGL